MRLDEGGLPLVAIIPVDRHTDHWTVTGDLRTPGSDCDENNSDYEDAVRNLLSPELVERVQFDSESSCFFAYCKTETDARLVAEAALQVAGVAPEPEDMVTMPRALVETALDALGVIVLTPTIKRYLKENDPMALAQTQAAIDTLARALGEPI